MRTGNQTKPHFFNLPDKPSSCRIAASNGATTPRVKLSADKNSPPRKEIRQRFTVVGGWGLFTNPQQQEARGREPGAEDTRSEGLETPHVAFQQLSLGDAGRRTPPPWRDSCEKCNLLDSDDSHAEMMNVYATFGPLKLGASVSVLALYASCASQNLARSKLACDEYSFAGKKRKERNSNLPMDDP